jgi:putative flippase GtrA
MLKKYFKKYNIFIKQGRDFLLFGTLNFLITNLVLQVSLFFLKIWLATLISQSLNFIIGYFLYSKYVFKVKIGSKLRLLKYLILSISAWYINLFLIVFFSKYFSISSNLGAVLAIPIIVIFSFFSQRFLIFKK